MTTTVPGTKWFGIKPGDTAFQAAKDTSKRVQIETVQSVAPGGRVFVGGQVVPVSGRITTPIKAGDIVAVIVEEGVRKLILRHETQKAKFPPPISRVEVLVGFEIAFFGEVVAGTVGFFVTSTKGTVAIDMPADGDFTPIGVIWGQNANVLLLDFTPEFGDRKFRVVRINREVGSDSLPTVKDGQGKVVRYRETETPLLSVTVVSDHDLVEDIDLDRTVTIRENLHVESFVDALVAELSSPTNGFLGLPRCALKKTPKFGGVTPSDFVIEQVQALNLDNSIPGVNVETEFLYAFVNAANQLVTLHRFTWRIGNLFDRDDPANQREIELFMAHTAPFPLPGSPIPLISDGAFSIINSSTSAFGRDSFFEGLGSPYPQFTRLPFGRVKIKPARSQDLPSTQFSDVFAVNRETQEVVGASFSDVIFEYDRDLVAATFQSFTRNHLDSGPLAAFHFDVIIQQTGTTTDYERDFLGRFTGFFGPGEYLKEDPTGFLDGTQFTPNTVRNIRVSGRGVGGFSSLSETEPFEQTDTPLLLFTLLALNTCPTGGLIGSGPINNPEYNSDLPSATVVPKDPTNEHNFLVPNLGRLDTRLNLGSPVLVALSAKPGSDVGVSVLRWAFPATLTFPIEERIGPNLAVVDLAAHDAAVFARLSDGDKVIVFADGVERVVTFVPGEFTFALPNSYTNDAEDDRRRYRAVIDDETLAVTLVKLKDIKRDLLKKFTVLGDAAFHFVQAVKG